ncbi:unnamed protein product [Darwinula stevensoni]|uniref:AAA+ ATPase domain-containing protein n=1 Tax=Darwinula stevensoni TaxID=69355 RepID=A0A7R9A7Y2_9CRUS|nr:unnamed protein product [Darwinula stevensoni]CAG0895619.1 unnamed protein product [Darwinula stevensoni]
MQLLPSWNGSEFTAGVQLEIIAVSSRDFKLGGTVKFPSSHCMVWYDGEDEHGASRLSVERVQQELQECKRFLEKCPSNSFLTPEALTWVRKFHTTVTAFNNGPYPNPNRKPDKNDEDDDNKISALLAKALLWMLTAYLFIVAFSLLFPSTNNPENVRYVSWNEFVHHMLARGEVEEIIVRPDTEIVTIILHEGAVVKGKKVDQRTYHMNIINIQTFEEKLREAEMKLGIRPEMGVPIVYERTSDAAGKLLTSLIIVIILLSLLSRSSLSIRPPLPTDMFSQLGRAKFTIIDPLAGGSRGVKFADVAGLKEVKQEVMEFVDYLRRPDFYKTLGAKVPRGAILLGPPGCGKTMLAKAVASEANVPFLAMNGSEFIEMIGGLGAARVRDLFKEARKRSPCIIYIDEIDAIGRKRSTVGGPFDGSSGESDQTLNQLLVEMDGMSSKEGVLMLASTNRQDALMRPGRFDRQIIIELPTLEERKEIFEQHLKGITLEHEPRVYSQRMASLTPGFSGADIANVCNEAALHAARDKHTKVVADDLEYAVERVVGGTEKRSSVMSPGEKRVVAYHESGHALVGWLLEHTDALLKVTIVPRTSHTLGFAQYTPTEQRLFSDEELFERMCMALGGRVAESLTFNRVSTGAQDDLKKITQMAYSQIRSYGLNQRVGPLSYPETEEKGVGRRPYSKKLAAVIDEEARFLVARAYKKTEAILLENKEKLEKVCIAKKVAEALLTREVLNYQDMEELIGPPSYPKKRLVESVQFELELQEQGQADQEPKRESRSPDRGGDSSFLIEVIKRSHS